MITVKFVGGAKKSFQKDQLELDKSEISIELIDEVFEFISRAHVERS